MDLEMLGKLIDLMSKVMDMMGGMQGGGGGGGGANPLGSLGGGSMS